MKAAGKGAGRVHLAYLERDGVTRDGQPGRLYSTFGDEVDRDAFLDRGIDYGHQFRFIVAPEDGARYADLKPFTRDLMARVEADLARRSTGSQSIITTRAIRTSMSSFAASPRTARRSTSPGTISHMASATARARF